jgi:hypothetical protein
MGEGGYVLARPQKSGVGFQGTHKYNLIDTKGDRLA